MDFVLAFVLALHTSSDMDSSYVRGNGGRSWGDLADVAACSSCTSDVIRWKKQAFFLDAAQLQAASATILCSLRVEGPVFFLFVVLRSLCACTTRARSPNVLARVSQSSGMLVPGVWSTIARILHDYGCSDKPVPYRYCARSMPWSPSRHQWCR